jgi:hypothetical protein
MVTGQRQIHIIFLCLPLRGMASGKAGTFELLIIYFIEMTVLVQPKTLINYLA